jgi:sugar phosphate permease
MSDINLEVLGDSAMSQDDTRAGRGRRRLLGGPPRLLGAWQLLAVAFVAQGAVSFVELGVPVLAPFVKNGLALSAFEVGIIVTAMNLGRMGGALPSGHVADRLGERIVLVGSGIGMAACAVAAAFAGPFWLILAVLAAAGVFAGATTPAGSRLVLAAFPRERRGLPMGIRQAAIPLGALVASLVLPPLAQALGWRAALAVAAAVPLAGALAAAGAMARVPPGAAGAAGSAALRSIAGNRKILLAGLWALLFVGGQYALLTYLVLYLDTELGFSLHGAFAVLSGATAAGFAGRLAWGWLSDAVFGSRRRPGLVLVTLTGIVAAVVLAVAPANGFPAITAAAATLGGFSLIGWQGLWVTMVSELAPEGASGTAVGYALTFTSAGIVLWPPLLGLTADVAGTFRWSWVLLASALTASLVPLAAIARVGRPST